MKAKMEKGQKPPEAGEYECRRCNSKFKITDAPGQQIVCPKCGNTNLDELVPIYMENNAEEEQMYNKADWQGGD